MALHTHQRHPTCTWSSRPRASTEGVSTSIRPCCGEWRHDFARMMRAQGSPRMRPEVLRGQTKRAAKDVFYRTQRRGHSYALRERLDGIVREASRNDAYHRPGASQAARDAKGGRARAGTLVCLEAGGPGRDRPRRPRPATSPCISRQCSRTGSGWRSSSFVMRGAEIAEDTRETTWYATAHWNKRDEFPTRR